MNYTYIVRCKDNTLYTGWTNNLEKRLKDHNEGRGAKYTKARLPVSLIYYEEFDEVIQEFTQAMAEAVEMKLDAIDKFTEIDNKHTMHTSSTKKKKRNTNF